MTTTPATPGWKQYLVAERKQRRRGERQDRLQKTRRRRLWIASCFSMLCAAGLLALSLQPSAASASGDSLARSSDGAQTAWSAR